ncbi:hypothetical protein AVEN_172383-1, partial [Araneus ventricosus]
MICLVLGPRIVFQIVKVPVCSGVRSGLQIQAFPDSIPILSKIRRVRGLRIAFQIVKDPVCPGVRSG